MTTITSNTSFKVQFNGSKTYFVCNSSECIRHFDSEKKAVNYFNKISKMSGVN